MIASTAEESLRKRAVLLGDKAYRELGISWIDEEISFLEQEENRAGGAGSAMEISERLADAYVRRAESEEGDGGDDQEMSMLDVMMRDLEDGNWL